MPRMLDEAYVMTYAYSVIKIWGYYGNENFWLRTVYDVRTIMQQQNEYIYIPDLSAYTNP